MAEVIILPQGHIYSPSPFHFMSHVMYECLPFQTQQTEVDIIIMS